MAEGANVAVRFDKLDKRALIEIANRLRMSQSHVLRTLVRETWKIIQEQDGQQSVTSPKKKVKHDRKRIQSA